MKKRLVKALLAMMVSVSVIGCNTIKTADSATETVKCYNKVVTEVANKIY